MITEADIAWAAGIFEGEGTAIYSGQKFCRECNRIAARERYIGKGN